MTLNITVANHWFVAQVSDRRLTDRRRLFDDRWNKAVVVGCRDAVLAITYTGLGYFNEWPVDEWVVKVLDQSKAVTREGGFAIRAICSAAAADWRRLPDADKRRPHTFIAAGWHWRRQRQMPYMWMVSNCDSLDGAPPSAPSGRFGVGRVRGRPDARAGEVSLVVVTGAERATTQKAVDGVGKLARTASDPKPVVTAMLEVIRSAAGHPTDGHLVGRDCMSVVLPRFGCGDAYAEYHPDGKPQVGYTPHVLWHGGTLSPSEVAGGGDFTIMSVGGRPFTIRSPTTELPPGVLFAMGSQRRPPRPNWPPA